MSWNNLLLSFLRRSIYRTKSGGQSAVDGEDAIVGI